MVDVHRRAFLDFTVLLALDRSTLVLSSKRFRCKPFVRVSGLGMASDDPDY